MSIFTLATWFLAVVSVLGVGGTVVALVFFPTVAMPLIEKIVQWLLSCGKCLTVAGFVLVALGSYWYGRHGEYDKGYEGALAAIAKEDNAAIQRATEMRSVWKECRQRNGEWDQSTGECK